jgi:hypothetical protein
MSQNIYLGVQSGYENTFRDEKIGKHANFAIYLQVPLASNWSLKINLMYFQKKHYGNQWDYEYRGTTYIARDAQLWRNSSLNIEINRVILKKIYLGTGVNACIIKFKRIEHDPYWPIKFTWPDKFLPNEIENREINLLRFGLSSLLGYEWEIVKKIVLVFEIRYILLFVGDEFGYGSLNFLESLSVCGGIKFGF